MDGEQSNVHRQGGRAMTTLAIPIPRRPVHPTGVWELDHDGRPQADRYPVRGDRLHHVHHGRAGGALHARSAGPSGAGPGQPRGVQPALHDARDHDDLPGDHADGRGVLQLPDPAADRRTGCGVPEAQRVQLLDLPERRAHPEAQLVPRRRPPTPGGSATRRSPAPRTTPATGSTSGS